MARSRAGRAVLRPYPAPGTSTSLGVSSSPAKIQNFPSSSSSSATKTPPPPDPTPWKPTPRHKTVLSSNFFVKKFPPSLSYPSHTPLFFHPFSITNTMRSTIHLSTIQKCGHISEYFSNLLPSLKLHVVPTMQMQKRRCNLFTAKYLFVTGLH